MDQPGFDDSAKIRVSLVVPVLDEAATINQLLESIEAQVRQPDEVIFVDGGSRDGTQDLLLAARAVNPKVRFIQARKASPGLGRNIGITNARYDWIALTDAGNRLDPHWLERLVETAESRPTAIVCGNYEPVIDSFFTECASIAYVPASIPMPGGTVRGPFIASSLVSSEAWQSVGGFPDMRAAEDLIFFEELSKKGHAIEWAPEAVVHWELRPSLGSTFRRFVLYSKWNVWGERQRHWHYRIALFYVAGLPFLVLAFINSWWWLLVPLSVLFTRVAKRIWEHRENRGVGWVLNPVRFAVVATVTLAIDLAMFVGWVGALIKPSQARRVRGMLQNLRYE